MVKKISTKRLAQLRVEAKLRIYHYEQQNGRCAKCGKKRWLQLSHKIPKSRGGESTIENTELLCLGCHAVEHNLSIILDSQPQWSRR